MPKQLLSVYFLSKTDSKQFLKWEDKSFVSEFWKTEMLTLLFQGSNTTI